MNLLRSYSKGIGYYPLAFYVEKPPIPVFPDLWNLELGRIELLSNGICDVFFRNGKTEQAIRCRFQYNFQTNFENFVANFSVGYNEGGNYNSVISNSNTTLYISKSENSSSYGDVIVWGQISKIAFEMRFFNTSDWLDRMPTDEELLQIDIEYLDLKS